MIEIISTISWFSRTSALNLNEILRLFLERGIPGVKDVSRVHYEKLRELIRQEVGRELDLPGGVTAKRDYECLRLRSRRESVWQPVRLECSIPSVHIVEMDGVFCRIALEVKSREELAGKIPEKDYTKWFDYDKIRDGLALRNPEEGDFFVLDKEGHRKKLARHYMDKKIAGEQRKKQFVLADGAHVVWSFPERISEDYKITENTKRVLVVTKERIRHEGRSSCID